MVTCINLSTDGLSVVVCAFVHSGVRAFVCLLCAVSGMRIVHPIECIKITREIITTASTRPIASRFAIVLLLMMKIFHRMQIVAKTQMTFSSVQ